MIWNWQTPGWPNFTWDRARLRKAEELFLIGSGRLAGVLRLLGEEAREQVTIDAISTEALSTSEIEGEILDRASVQSSVRRQFGLSADRQLAKSAEQGVAEMMTDLYRTFAAPLTEETLFGWHRMLMKGRRDLMSVGEYRSGSEPMQVVSGAIHRPRIHFEAPPSSTVRREMKQFIKWFNGTSPSGRDRLPALTRAGISHLYFESVHPFEDGNGRIGRLVSEKALAQSAGQPALTALAATILLRRKAYYSQFESGNKDLDVTHWLSWFGGIVLEAQRRAEAQVEFVIEKTRLLDRLRDSLSERQEIALLRMLREGPQGFKGGLSAGNYATITRASPATTTRDLADLVAKGALHRTGELRHARYHLTEQPRTITRVQIDEQGNVNTN